jgi:retron-type reverse transcriptase
MHLSDIFTFKNLYLAERKARLGKRHKKDVILFEMGLLANLSQLAKEINEGSYRVSGYHHFTIHEPKKREIQALLYRDRVVQHCLVDNYLMPLLERHLIKDNCACRKGKGTDYARKRVRQFMADSYKANGRKAYVLRFDIHHYFDSIDHTVLKMMLKKLIPDGDVLMLCFDIIDSYSFNGNGKTGIPMGNQTSQCFALYYLDGIDRILKEKFHLRWYCRYMDDGIVICQSKELLKDLLFEIRWCLDSLKLSLNDKTVISSLKRGFKFLGFRYSYFPKGGIKINLNRQVRQRISEKLNEINLVFYKAYFSVLAEQNFLKNACAKMHRK